MYHAGYILAGTTRIAAACAAWREDASGGSVENGGEVETITSPPTVPAFVRTRSHPVPHHQAAPEPGDGIPSYLCAPRVQEI